MAKRVVHLALPLTRDLCVCARSYSEVSDEAVDFIDHLLVVDRKQRYTADQALVRNRNCLSFSFSLLLCPFLWSLCSVVCCCSFSVMFLFLGNLCKRTQAHPWLSDVTEKSRTELKISAHLEKLVITQRAQSAKSFSDF